MPSSISIMHASGSINGSRGGDVTKYVGDGDGDAGL